MLGNNAMFTWGVQQVSLDGVDRDGAYFVRHQLPEASPSNLRRNRH